MSSEPAGPRRWRPRLRTVLLVVNLVAVLLPLGGVALLRLYDNELIRQTEAELVAQGALVAALYRDALLALPVGADARPLGAVLAQYGRATAAPDTFAEDLRPLTPGLDLARDRVRGQAGEARAAAQPPDRFGLAAGVGVSPTLRRAQGITLAGIRVVDFNGIVVATTRGELGLSLAHREEVARALRGELVRFLRERVSDEPAPPPWSISRGTGVRVFVALPLIEQGRLLGAVVLSRTPMSLAQALYVNRLQLTLLGAAVLALVLGVSLLTSRLIARPVRSLMRQVRRAGEGERDAMVPLRHAGTLEVAELSEAFARMSRRLADRADYIRAFARAVSHEFKSPLTSIRGSVELLRDHLETMTGDERERFLAMVEADAARLDRLVSRLHELARADVAEPAGEVVALWPVLESLVERWRGADRRVALEAGADGFARAALVGVAREVLETIVGNLVDNAFQHAGREASVRIEVGGSERAEGGGLVEVVVRDDGPGVSSANRGRLFEAFFTTARERGGSGLGLPIVAALVRAHGGDVRLLDTTEGAAFGVRLPRAPGVSIG